MHGSLLIQYNFIIDYDVLQIGNYIKQCLKCVQTCPFKELSPLSLSFSFPSFVLSLSLCDSAPVSDSVSIYYSQYYLLCFCLSLCLCLCLSFHKYRVGTMQLLIQSDSQTGKLYKSTHSLSWSRYITILGLKITMFWNMKTHSILPKIIETPAYV